MWHFKWTLPSIDTTEMNGVCLHHFACYFLFQTCHDTNKDILLHDNIFHFYVQEMLRNCVSYMSS